MDNGKMFAGSDARRSFRVSLVEISRHICNRIGENFQQILRAIRIEEIRESMVKYLHTCVHSQEGNFLLSQTKTCYKLKNEIRRRRTYCT